MVSIITVLKWDQCILFVYLFIFVSFYLCVVCFFFFFFFQAEDGIRDGRVTGVQTCALPISALAAAYRSSSVLVCASEHEGFCVPLLEAMAFDVPVVAFHAAAVPETLGRSEERRVGKECRSRWWTDP